MPQGLKAGSLFSLYWCPFSLYRVIVIIFVLNHIKKNHACVNWELVLSLSYYQVWFPNIPLSVFLCETWFLNIPLGMFLTEGGREVQYVVQLSFQLWKGWLWVEK